MSEFATEAGWKRFAFLQERLQKQDAIATVWPEDDDDSCSNSQDAAQGEVTRQDRLRLRSARRRQRKALTEAKNANMFGSVLEAGALRTDAYRQQYQDAVKSFEATLSHDIKSLPAAKADEILVEYMDGRCLEGHRDGHDEVLL